MAEAKSQRGANSLGKEHDVPGKDTSHTLSLTKLKCERRTLSLGKDSVLIHFFSTFNDSGGKSRRGIHSPGKERLLAYLAVLLETQLYGGVNEDHEDPGVKYTRRGWRCEKAVANGDTKNAHSLQFAGRRRIGDSYTWSIALDTNAITAGQPANYIVQMDILKSCILLEECTTPAKYYDPFAFWDSVQPKLESLTHSQLLKYHWPEPRRMRCRGKGYCNPRYADLASEMAGQEPEGWTFYDGQISTCRRETGERDQAELEHHIMNELKTLIFEQEKVERGSAKSEYLE
ncbi:hypothetical protein DSL72_004218 [Monilinia vaccinii-corymbosi]|uniref:Uncharacterized protein n=1 Tax=Monilinia vaccinii-corymbosi TaxID=61207 RepID=A0A8A3P456_9HELO|nr:hypothetical protein DSL72_004218 [Monilinia vaccinii-corymbosi]